MKHTVAAIIPLYNGREFIRESLESVLAQTVPVEEIIVVDDGSTDGGADIVEAIMREHANFPIRLLRKANGGQSSARNMAIASTDCDLIALLDQDDAWYRDHIALLREPFEGDDQEEIGLVYGNLDQIDIAGRIILRCCLDSVPTNHPKISRMQCLAGDLFILPGASMFRKSHAQKVGLFDERLSGYEDDDLFLRMFSCGMKLVYLNTAVSKWRIYSGSTSFSPRMAKSRMIYFHKLVEHYPNDPALDLYWTRDVIAPRFFSQTIHEFLQGLKFKDNARVTYAIESAKQIAPFLPDEHKKIFNRSLPVVNLMLRFSLTSLASKWVRSRI